MRKEFAKWEIKTSVFSGRKPQAGNYCDVTIAGRFRSSPRSAEFKQPETVRARTGSAGNALSWVPMD
jgi:hypothetical protein